VERKACKDYVDYLEEPKKKFQKVYLPGAKRYDAGRLAAVMEYHDGKTIRRLAFITNHPEEFAKLKSGTCQTYRSVTRSERD
jgi:hypothetical protein